MGQAQRGVPVILATFAVIGGVPQGIEQLNIAFFAVLVSAGLRSRQFIRLPPGSGPVSASADTLS